MSNARLGYDDAWSHLDPRTAYQHGYRFALRYVSDDPTKDLTAAELSGLHAAGLGVGLVFETTATRATQGANAGTDDRTQAEIRAASLHFPATVPIAYAVDEDVTGDSVAAYFESIMTKHTHPVCAYGSLAVVEFLRSRELCHYAWQTEAWSGDAVSRYADMYQRVHPTVGLSGSFDEDVMFSNYPLFYPTTTATPSRPTVPSWYKRELYATNPPTIHGFDVEMVQRKVRVATDGWYGANTKSHVEMWQRSHGLTPDGIVGPITAASLGA